MSDHLRSYCCELLRLLTKLRVSSVVEDRDGYFMVAGRCYGYVDALHESGAVCRDIAARMRDLIASACANSWRGAIPDARNAGPCIPFHIAMHRRWAAEQSSVPPAEPVAVRAESKSKEGWGQPYLARKSHYFINGQSICNRWLYTGPVLDRLLAPSLGCAACKRHLAVKPQAPVQINEREQVPAPATSRILRLLCLLVPSRTGSRALPVHTLRPMPPRICGQGRWNLEGDTGFYLRETHAVSPAPEVLERYSRHGQANALRSGSRAVSRAGGQL